MTLKVLISDSRFESDHRGLLRKPEFLFGDSIKEDEEDLYNRKYKYLRQIDNR